MPDNRLAPAAHSAKAPEGEVSAPDKGAASASSELRGTGLHGTAAAGAGGGAPAARRSDAAAAAEPQAISATPVLRNAPPPSDPVAKTFPESWREDLAGGDKTFRKTLDRFENPVALAKAYKELTARLSSGAT